MADQDIKLPYKLPSFHDWQPHATFYHPMYAGSIDGTDLYPHDRAVVRAILSRYKPNKNVIGDQNKTLFVARLSKDTNEDTIRNMFEEYGELEKCRLIRDFVTGFSRGYAFVEFKRKKDALNAARETHRMNIDGKQILVDFECERNLDGWKPRRFGGGFGGRKESGQLRFGGIDRPFRRPLPDKVNHFNRGRQHEDNASSQESRGDQGRMNRDKEKYEYDKDRKTRGHGRDYKSNDRDKNRDHKERDRGSREHSRDHKHRDYRDKREHKHTHKDKRHDRRGRDDHYRDRNDHDRDRDDHYRDRDDHYRDRDGKYRDRRHRDKESSRDTKGDVGSGCSNSSRDPD